MDRQIQNSENYLCPNGTPNPNYENINVYTIPEQPIWNFADIILNYFIRKQFVL